ncbi:MAG TPA: response regulator transcription factor, partial [Solirubrobacteraceae bacterium]
VVEDPLELLDLLARRRPDVCVLHSGALAAEELLALIDAVVVGRQTPVLVLDDDCGSRVVVGAFEAGAQAVLHAADVRTSLAAAVCAVASGLTACGPRARAGLLGVLAPRVSERLTESGLQKLTPRELEILELVANGLSNGDIAQRLGLCDKTVKSHLSHLFSKLAVRDRAQLVIAAFEVGLVRPPEAALRPRTAPQRRLVSVGDAVLRPR